MLWTCFVACEQNRVGQVDQVSLEDTRDPVNTRNIKTARGIEAPGSQDFHGALKLVCSKILEHKKTWNRRALEHRYSQVWLQCFNPLAVYTR